MKSMENLAGGYIVGLLAYVAFLLMILVVCTVLYVLAYWFIFAKAGDKGWKALIPIYSTYTEYKLVWNKRMFALYMGLAIIANVLAWMGGAAALVSYLFSLACMVMYVLSCVKLGQSFGKGAGFIVGLVLVNIVFVLILAFDSSRYVGPEGRSRFQ